eukprot:Opistho-2@44143
MGAKTDASQAPATARNRRLWALGCDDGVYRAVWMAGVPRQSGMPYVRVILAWAYYPRMGWAPIALIRVHAGFDVSHDVFGARHTHAQQKQVVCLCIKDSHCNAIE